MAILKVKCKKCKGPVPSGIEAPIEAVRQGKIRMRGSSYPCPHCGHRDLYNSEDFIDSD